MTQTPANETRHQETAEVVETPSIISVDIIGYGDGSDSEDDEDKENGNEGTSE